MAKPGWKRNLRRERTVQDSPNIPENSRIVTAESSSVSAGALFHVAHTRSFFFARSGISPDTHSLRSSQGQDNHNTVDLARKLGVSAQDIASLNRERNTRWSSSWYAPNGGSGP